MGVVSAQIEQLTCYLVNALKEENGALYFNFNVD